MKTRTSRCILLLLTVMIAAPVSATGGENRYPLTVHVSGAIPGKGLAVMSLFSSSDTYLKEPLVKRTKPIDGAGNTVFVIEQLHAGTYAVSIVYDEDSNGKLNTGFLGIPTELVGFSNNVTGTFGPPSFEKASFSLFEPRSLVITLGKAKN